MKRREESGERREEGVLLWECWVVVAYILSYGDPLS